MSANQKTRRNFLKMGAALAGTALTGQSGFWGSQAWAATGVVVLSGKNILKFVSPLVNPLDPSWLAKPDTVTAATYTLRIEQITQSLGLNTLVNKVATPLPKTTVWGYRGQGMASASYPGPTFDLNSGGGAITVNFVNNLVTVSGSLLPNPMPVDLSIDWANPGSKGGTAPIPVATHLHGGDNKYAQDGLPDAWVTPGVASAADQAACNPAGSAAGTACTGRVFASSNVYENTQLGGFLWYHDHALGITRTNVYMGLAGLYFLREKAENDLRAPTKPTPVLPSFPYEVPLVLQDRMFDTAGQLYYPSAAPLLTTATSPSIQPEFFGDVILVNTQAWPLMKVEPRPYRFRLLNGSDSRAYELKLLTRTGTAGPAITVIGNDLGLLDKPATPGASYAAGPIGVLAIMPGERYDVIIDFSAFVPKNKTRLLLTNSATSPYSAGVKPVAGQTDQVMAFEVSMALNQTKEPKATISARTVLRAATSTTPATTLPVISTLLSQAVTTRKILMYEGLDKLGRLQTMLGTVDPVTTAQAWDTTNKKWVSKTGAALQGTLTFQDDITETPKAGTTEIWEFYNTTVDSHPMHMHLVDFRIVDRQAFTGVITAKTNTDASTGGVLTGIAKTGLVRKAGAWEAGRKDTVQCHAGEVTRVVVTFAHTGEYVYHCHILSHEDHEMMRRYLVV